MQPLLSSWEELQAGYKMPEMKTLWSSARCPATPHYTTTLSSPPHRLTISCVSQPAKIQSAATPKLRRQKQDRAWNLMPAIAGPWKLRQKDCCEFELNLGYPVCFRPAQSTE